MKKIKIFQVDAFTDKLFSGNPAAVCMLERWPDDSVLQSIAAENNLPETAFMVSRIHDFEIRWFTPVVEVDLCGHATLAAAYVLYNCLDYIRTPLQFQSRRSGELRVFKQEDFLYLDFPADKLKKTDEAETISQCIGATPVEVLKGKSDYFALVENETIVRELKPDFAKIAMLKARGLIVTAKGQNVDFVSRFFAPQSGINEDPVTGSAHTSLIPYWSAKLKKNEMKALQLSARGGELVCKNNGTRCLIGGKAKLYLIGEILTE
ncbi:MAG: PhzF family phenazine biosynthesis protein [Bacteroidales bacterium]